MGRLPEEKRMELMMMRVFMSLAEILLGIGIKRLLAAKRAKIIRLPLVFGCAGSSSGVDIHVANGVMYSGCHKLVSFPLYYAINRQPQREPYY